VPCPLEAHRRRSVGETQFENIRDLIVLESHRIQEQVLGMLRNGYPVRVTGPIGASVACFSPSGRLLYIADDFTDQDEVGPRGTLPFQVDTSPPYGSSGLSCSKYLVGASGFTALAPPRARRCAPVSTGPEWGGESGASTERVRRCTLSLTKPQQEPPGLKAGIGVTAG
jgi:hypothetical protein